MGGVHIISFVLVAAFGLQSGILSGKILNNNEKRYKEIGEIKM